MDRIIRAESVGCRVPKEVFLSSVHSVFHVAANLSVAGLDHLLTIYISKDTYLPQGIRLPVGSEAILQNLEVGQSLRCQDGRLFLGAVKIDLRGAHEYDGQLEQAPINLESSETLSAWQAAYNLLVQRQEEKGADLRIAAVRAEIRGAGQVELARPDGISQGGIAGKLCALILAARRLDSIWAPDCVRALVGLGGGLTPAGDDALVGFLAALWSQAAGSPDRMGWLKTFQSALLNECHRTNDISRTYLVLAAENQFSSSLAGLAKAICAGQPAERVHAAAEIAFQTGHTSGLDAATGLLCGLAAWNEILFSEMKGTK